MANRFRAGLSSRSLRIKLLVAFLLASVIPVLILLNMIFPSAFSFLREQGKMQPLIFNRTVILAITIWIIIMGYYLLRQIVDPIVSISKEVNDIASGNYNRTITSGANRKDEIGDLSGALDKLTSRIRNSMEELSTYGEKTRKINDEINRRVIILSNLLQLSSLISKGARLEEVLNLSIDKVMQVGCSEMGFLMIKEETGDDKDFIMKCIRCNQAERFSYLKVKMGQGLLGSVLKDEKAFVIDSNYKHTSPDIDQWRALFGMRNAIIAPVTSPHKRLGLMCIANNLTDFTYGPDDKELMDIFVKQVAIALETDFLHFRLNKLEIRDALTGLFNDRFIQVRLEEEIKRAIIYQRPCSFLLFNVDNFKRYYTLFGGLSSENALKKIGLVLEESVSEIDKVARFGDNEFAVLMPEKNKKEATKLAEEIRKKIEYLFKEEDEPNKRLTVSGAVSENPLDGAHFQDLIIKARERLQEAKAHGKNQVKV